MNSAMEVLRRNVVYKRAQHGFSQSVLAERAKVARQTVSKIESGSGGRTVTVEVLEKIAIVLGCRVDQLFDPCCVHVDASELQRRANAPNGDFIDGFALLNAIDEANHEIRYSPAGRRKAVGNKTTSASG
jgi:transcriptional regulator with XRE-family HTH domain